MSSNFGDTGELVKGIELKNAFASVVSQSVPLGSILSGFAPIILSIPCKQRTAIELWHVRAAFNPSDASGKLTFFQCFLNVAWKDTAGNFTQGGFGAYEYLLGTGGMTLPAASPAVANWGMNYSLDCLGDPLLIRQADLGGGASVVISVIPVIWNTDGAGAHSFQFFGELLYREVAQEIQ